MIILNHINSLLAKNQKDNSTSNKEGTKTQNNSEKQLLEQQFNDLLLDLNQYAQDEYFICQEECKISTEEYFLRFLHPVN